jgi:hypothetical protein
MKGLMLLAVLFVSSYALAGSGQEPVVNIYKADTSIVSGKLVRYYQTLDTPCIKVQILKPGGSGVASNSIDFCSISGKSFASDFAEVWLEKGEFSNSELSLTVKLSPLTQAEDKVEVCRFKVEGETLSGPSCGVQ